MKKVTLISKQSLLIFLVSTVISNAAIGRLPELMHPNSPTPTIKREAHTLFLNGQGIHTVTIFKIKVYEISLFLEHLSGNPEEIVQSPEKKVILLRFLRDVDAEQLRSAFSDGFYENCVTQCDRLRIFLDQLNSQIPNLKEGDRLEFQFSPTQVSLRLNLEKSIVVNSRDFGRILISIWLGQSPPSQNLRKMLLGSDLKE